MQLLLPCARAVFNFYLFRLKGTLPNLYGAGSLSSSSSEHHVHCHRQWGILGFSFQLSHFVLCKPWARGVVEVNRETNDKRQPGVSKLL